MSYKSFKLTNNSKVRFYDGHENTCSLKQGLPIYGGTCPGATGGECGCLKVCYDKNLRRLYKAYAAVEDYNTSLVLGKTYDEMRNVINNSVLKWLLNGGDEQQYFRIHTGGDFFNEDYARAWASVIKEHSTVNFWTYTRSHFAVPILAGIKNLTLMLSCDPENKEDVLKIYNEYSHIDNIAVAWMGDDFPEELIDRKYLDCPEVTGKIKNTKMIGACARCRACIDRPLKDGKIRHIRFPIHR
jgi:hypothetical protein